MALLRVGVLRASLAAALVSVAGPSWSQSSSGAEITLAEIARRSVEARYGRMSDQWQLPRYPGRTVTPSSGGSVVVSHPIRGPGPGPGGIIDVEARVVVPKSNIAKALVKGLPVIGAGIAGYEILSEILDAARVKDGPGGTVVMDKGQAEQSLNSFNGVRSGCLGKESPEAAHACDIAWQEDQWQPTHWLEIVTPTEVVTVNSNGTKRLRTQYKRCRASTSPGGSPVCDSTITLDYTPTVSVVIRCPDGQVPSFWADDWCTTPVDNWEVVDEDEARQRVEPKIAPGTEPDVWRALDGAGQPIEGSIPTVVGPTEIPVSRERTDNPDGSVTVKDTSSPIEYGPVPSPSGGTVPGYRWGEKTETRTYPPGEVVPELGQPGGGTPGGTTTVDPGSGTTGDEIITCGLPWTPPCKINEDGTPPPMPPDGYDDPDDELDPIRGIIENPPIAELEWSWSFQLPTGCSPYPLPAFAPYIESIDMCQYQPMIHDLVSVLWYGATVWVLVGMFTRTFSGS